MQMKISYMKRYFLKIFLAVVVLVGVLVAVVNGFSKDLMGKEIISLHQSILSQSTSRLGENIRDLKETVGKTAENAEVIEWLSGETGHEETVHSFIQNEIFGNYKKGNKFRIYLYDMEGILYGSDRIQVPREQIQSVISQSSPSVSEGKSGTDTWIQGPVCSDTEEGLYRYSFYLLREVCDLVTGERKGYVLMQCSETALYDNYMDLISKDRDYCITDAEGRIISARNKSTIGDVYEKNEILIENREPLGNGYGISETYENSVYFYENISGTEWYLVENADMQHIFAPLNRAARISYGLVLLFAICFLPATFLALRVILKPIDSIKNKMKRVAEGDLKVWILEEEKGKGELSEIADSFNDMVGKLNSQVEEIKQIERKRHLLQLDFLQTQINPHFIYNTLSSIRFYVEMGKNEEAEQMLIDFSKILRKTLSSSEKFISLREELETLNYYIDLQRARYRDRFEVEFDISEETLPCVVPDFVMQPIVENAIFYSLKEKQVCHIKIRSYIEEMNLYVSIQDDGIGMNEDKISQVLEKGMNMNKVGIRNVQERLRLNFGEPYGLKILSQEGIGTEVILMMPVTIRGKESDENTDCR